MYGIYKVINKNNSIVYIGSTSLSLDQLEKNHRNARSLGYTMTSFRSTLEDQGDNWRFKWAEKPRNISREHAEIIEGALIRAYNPVYNKSRYPYERSVHEGRFEDVFGDVLNEESC